MLGSSVSCTVSSAVIFMGSRVVLGRPFSNAPTPALPRLTAREGADLLLPPPTFFGGGGLRWGHCKLFERFAFDPAAVDYGLDGAEPIVERHRIRVCQA